jgi:hypothetical protein
MSDRLFADHAALAAVCRRFHVRRLSLFGSTLRGTAWPDSDIDLLVDLNRHFRSVVAQMAEVQYAA